MIVTQTLYDAHCDNCGKGLTDPNPELEFSSMSYLLKYMRLQKWKELNKGFVFKHYCPDCWTLHKEEILEINKK